MTAYLELHPPASRQFGPRRGDPSGAIVLHSTESKADIVGNDGGAEAVASFISIRDEPGSYHKLSDSDSRIQLIEFDLRAFGARTGNDWAIHLSVAMRAAEWSDLPEEWRSKAINQLVLSAVEAARWLWETHSIRVPPMRITAAEYRAGEPGFIDHGSVDPARRTDPGPHFPWDEFLSKFGAATAQQISSPTTNGDPEMIANLLASYRIGGAAAGNMNRTPTPDDVELWLADLEAKASRGDNLNPTYQWIIDTTAAEPGPT